MGDLVSEVLQGTMNNEEPPVKRVKVEETVAVGYHDQDTWSDVSSVGLNFPEHADVESMTPSARCRPFWGKLINIRMRVMIQSMRKMLHVVAA